MTLIDAAARAYALVCLADGRLANAESTGFRAFATADPAFAETEIAHVDAAWSGAQTFVAGLEMFDAVTPLIAGPCQDDAARDAVMRAAQAALIIDGENAAQENAAIAAIAESLGFDPRAQ